MKIEDLTPEQVEWLAHNLSNALGCMENIDGDVAHKFRLRIRPQLAHLCNKFELSCPNNFAPGVWMKQSCLDYDECIRLLNELGIFYTEP